MEITDTEKKTKYIHSICTHWTYYIYTQTQRVWNSKPAIKLFKVVPHCLQHVINHLDISKEWVWTKEPIYHHVGFYVSMISLAYKKTWLVVLTMRRFDLKNQRSKSWVRSNVKVIYWVQHRINWIHIHFISCQADLAKQTSSWDETVWKLDLENPRSRS